jgi:hypothetical protein
MMRARTSTAVAAAGVVLLACTSASAATGGPASAGRGAAQPPNACATWQIVSSPAPGFTAPPQPSSEAEFASVSVLSGHDVWFAGLNDAGPGTTGPWAVHWNGHSVTAPQEVPLIPQAQSPYLDDLNPGSFDSDTDGWILAPTQVYPTFDPYAAFGYHWHGGGWTTVPMAVSPDPSTEGPRFSAVAAVSADDAWAVGTFYSTKVLFGVDAVGALIAHWDGTAWSIVPNPAMGQPGAVLNAISVVSPTDIWAVGQQGNPNQLTDAGDSPFIEHWDGSAWTIVPSPPGSTPSYLEGVGGDGATDAWAVGYQTEAGTSRLGPLVEHWDGTAWSAVSLPGTMTGLYGLNSVYAAAPGDVWATEGGSQYPDSPGSSPPVFLHLDGTAWTTVAEPGPQEAGLGYLYMSIGGTGPGNVWAAGTVATGYPGDLLPLIAHLSCGPGGRG